MLYELKNSTAFYEELMDLVPQIFANFDFLTHQQFIIDLKNKIKFNKLKRNSNEHQNSIFIHVYEHFKNFVKELEVFDRMSEDIDKMYSFFSNLSEDDMIAIYHLFFSLPISAKNAVINNLLNLNYSVEALLIFYTLCDKKLISIEERVFLFLINCTYDLFLKDPAGKIFLENNLHLYNVKNALINFKPNCNYTEDFFIYGIICKNLNDIYLLDKDNDSKYDWEELYDKIFEKLNLKKEKTCLLYIFKNIIKEDQLFVQIFV